MAASFLDACQTRASDYVSEWPESPARSEMPAPRPLMPKQASRDPSALDLMLLASSRNNSFNLGSPVRNSSFTSTGSPRSPARRLPKVNPGMAAVNVLGASSMMGASPPQPPRRIISFLNNNPAPLLPPPLTAADGLMSQKLAPVAFPGAHGAFDGGRAVQLLASTGAAATPPASQ